MSRIGKTPIILSSDTQIDINDSLVTVRGPKGKLAYELPQGINITHNLNQIIVHRNITNKTTKQLHGLSRTILNNIIIGVTRGFYKKLQIQGVGYRAQIDNQNNLVLNVGYSHPITINSPQNINITVENNTTIKIEGINKETVGQIAAQIRSVRPPEPYKGKGIKYENEKIRKKVGKAGK